MRHRRKDLILPAFKQVEQALVGDELEGLLHVTDAFEKDVTDET